MNTKDQLLRKLFGKECTREELEQLFEILQRDREETGPEVMMELFEQLETTPALNPAVSHEILTKIKRVTHQEGQSGTVIPARTRRLRIWQGVAAAVLLLIATSWGIFQWSQPKAITVRSSFDEMREIVLPDGSLVTLNGNSKIEYAPKWKEGQLRVVKLWGEAFFKVEKKPATKAKFQVITEDLTVEVLGTAFNVNTRQDASEVFLEEGRISLSLRNTDNPKIRLQPGEVVTYSSKRKQLLEPQTVDQALEISWKDGFLTFKDTPLKKILEELFATSAYEFEVKDTALEAREFRLTFPNNDMEAAIKLLDRTLKDHQIIKEENKFVIIKK